MGVSSSSWLHSTKWVSGRTYRSVRTSHGMQPQTPLTLQTDSTTLGGGSRLLQSLQELLPLSQSCVQCGKWLLYTTETAGVSFRVGPSLLTLHSSIFCQICLCKIIPMDCIRTLYKWYTWFKLYGSWANHFCLCILDFGFLSPFSSGAQPLSILPLSPCCLRPPLVINGICTTTRRATR